MRFKGGPSILARERDRLLEALRIPRDVLFCIGRWESGSQRTRCDTVPVLSTQRYALELHSTALVWKASSECYYIRGVAYVRRWSRTVTVRDSQARSEEMDVKEANSSVGLACKPHLSSASPSLTSRMLWKLRIYVACPIRLTAPVLLHHRHVGLDFFSDTMGLLAT